MKTGPVRNEVFRSYVENTLADIVALEIDIDELLVRMTQAQRTLISIHNELAKLDSDCHQVKWQTELLSQ